MLESLTMRRSLAAAGGLLAALAVAAPALAGNTTTVTASVNTKLAVSAPASLTFPNLSVDDSSATGQAATVNVISNSRTGYALSASRTAFSPAASIPLGISVATAPTGTTLHASLAGNANVAVPTSGSQEIGRRGSAPFITSALGDDWATSVNVGPVGFVEDGNHTSTVTFTAVALP
jgi:hypothetical protein